MSLNPNFAINTFRFHIKQGNLLFFILIFISLFLHLEETVKHC